MRRPGVQQVLALLLVLSGILVFVTRGYHDEHKALRLRDFKQPYASARCLLEGCNPYSGVDTLRAYEQAHGPDDDKYVIGQYSALYPPFSFAVLAPIGALSFPHAASAWMALIAVLFSLAVLLVALVCVRLAALASALVLALLAATSTILLMLGQITGPVVALLAIGVCCLLADRLSALAVGCFTIALLLKPHDAAFVVLYLLFATRAWRRIFVWTAAMTAVLAVAGILWCALQPASAHWLTDLRANLAGNSMPGGVNDPHKDFFEAVNLADLQGLLAPELPAAAAYKSLGYLISLVLLGVWAVPAVRMRNSLPKHLLALGCMAVFTLLPVYHRQYDTRLLLLAVPAAAWLVAWRPRSWGASGIVLLLLADVFTSHQYIHVLTSGRFGNLFQASGLKTTLVFRPLPWVALVLLGFFLAAFWAAYGASRQQPERAFEGEQRFPSALRER